MFNLDILVCEIKSNVEFELKKIEWSQAWPNKLEVPSILLKKFNIDSTRT